MRLDRDKFYSVADKAKVSFSLSKDEETARGICELLLRNVIVLLPKKNWVTMFFGYHYPYFIDDEKSVSYQIEYYLKHYDEEIKKIKPIQNMILKNRVVDVFKKLPDRNVKFAKDFIVSFVYLLTKDKEFTMKDIIKLCDRKKKDLIYDYSFSSTFELLKALEELNYNVITKNNGELYFSKS